MTPSFYMFCRSQILMMISFSSAEKALGKS